MEQLSRLSHKDLILWQKALDLAVLAHHACNFMPRSETYGLAAQLRRAATSIPSNIAEGYARRSVKEYVYFLHVARGSMAELETQLLLAQRVGYLPDSEATDLQGRIGEVGRILNAVVAGLNRRQ
ncbi:MAG: four helix bundle protein [Steroidobacteraceae bacterium]